MKKTSFLCLLTILALLLAGCSGGGGDDVPPPPVHSAHIYSDQAADGDIAYDPVTPKFTINIAPPILFFGIDDSDPNFPEYRAFLDFPLDGTTGSDVVPVDARIVSATLEVFVNEVSFALVVPTLIDLVIYPISGLQAADFNSVPFLTQGVDFLRSDEGAIVAFDLTPLMREAQRLELPDLQLRFLLDLTADRGFVSLDDQPTVSLTAPLLKVRYVF